MRDFSPERKRIKAHFKAVNSTLRVVGGDPECNYKVVVRCVKCKKQDSRNHGYWLQYGCNCQRGALVSAKSKTTSSEVKRILRDANLRQLGEYVNMNTALDVQCRLCGLKYAGYVGNIRKGHGCAKCGSAKRIATNMKRYGGSGALADKKVRSKHGKTMLARYGVKHALQNRKLFDQNLTTAFQLKEVQLGKRIVLVQGYEPQALAWLLANTKLKPSDIRCGAGDCKVPSIKYELDGKQCVYHPDIFIPAWNKIIEVKSSYTRKINQDVNQAKRRACKEQGFKFGYLVMDKNGNRIN